MVALAKTYAADARRRRGDAAANAKSIVAIMGLGVARGEKVTITAHGVAMDRGHPKLAAQVDPCNPAVLTLIGSASHALHERGKWIGVCGGVASDPQAVPILVGLGVDELSCSIPAIPSVKAAVRRYSLLACRELAAKAVTCSTPAEVRALVPVDED